MPPSHDGTDGPAPPDAALILLVDDDQDAREGWAEFLHDAGYRVSQASDGCEALEKIATRIPDLVVLDLGIPRIDGRELTRRLRRTPEVRHVPIVALTGLDYPDLLEDIMAAGCHACLSKPCEPARLLAVIRGLLHRVAH